jgi:hypothetical protein
MPIAPTPCPSAAPLVRSTGMLLALNHSLGFPDQVSVSSLDFGPAYKPGLFVGHVDFAGLILCINDVRNGGLRMAQIGCARVSTDGQSLAAQTPELKTAEIFQEKVSGAKSDRKQLARLISRLDDGDVLMVTRLDRLARSTRDLLNVLGAVARKPKLTQHQQQEAIARRDAGESLVDIARSYNVSHSTISRLTAAHAI